MKIIQLAALAVLPGVVMAAGPADSPAGGRWEGAVQIQKKAVPVAIDLAQDQNGKWTGSVEFPAQKLTRSTFSTVTIKDASVYLESRESLLAIDLKLSPGGQAMQGDFESGFLLAIPVPVRLQRVSPPATPEACESTSLANALVGVWQGDLKLESSWEPGDPRVGSTAALRLTLENGPDGLARGSLKKTGSSDPELPLSAIQQSPGHLRFEVKGAGVSYTAELHDRQLAGQWNQFDLDPVPLRLTRVEPK